MSQMAAVGETHAEEFVAGSHERHVDGHVGLGARVGLHVGSFSTKEFTEALDRESLDVMDELTTPVIALAGVAFSLLVGED